MIGIVILFDIPFVTHDTLYTVVGYISYVVYFRYMCVLIKIHELYTPEIHCT